MPEEDPLNAEVVTDPQDDKNDPIVEHVRDFKGESEKIVNNELPDWLDAQDMYLSCLDPTDDLVNLFNPDILFDSIQRVLEQYKLADYFINIPGLSSEEEQVIRDAIRQTKKRSGLISGLRDNPRGALSQLLFGATIIWWGAQDKEMVDNGIPIKFQFPALNQCFFSSNATMIRTPNGDSDANEALIVFEFPKNEVNEMFPKAEEAMQGKLSFMDENDELQEEETDTDDENDMTQVGHYYNIEKGVYYIIVGASDTIVESFSDEESSMKNYPFKMEGKNYIPIEMFRTFPVPSKLYPRGFYHKFGKIARNDVRRRNAAHRYVERNIDPDKFIEMPDSRFATFAMKVEEARLARAQGSDFYIPVNPGEKPVFSDARTQPLSAEFERMKDDNLNLVKQGGVAIQDVDRPVSETATATASEEFAKTRLPSQITRINAGASLFLTKIIAEFLKLVPDDSDAPVDTEVRVKFGEKETAIGETIDLETRVKNITYGDVSAVLNENKLFIEEDLSQYDGIGLEFTTLNSALPLVAGTPQGSKIIQKMLGLLGQDVNRQDITQSSPPSNETQPQGGAQLPSPQNSLAIPTLR